MFDDRQKLSKLDVEVQVYLDDGSRLLGVLAVSQGQRISDLLNDDRQFLPLRTSEGTVAILRKTTIARVVPLNQQIDRDKVTDPYEILGVSREVSDQELKRFYHAMCSENHPDKVQSSGLSPDFLEMANSRMLRINDAYERIVSMRRAEGANGQDAEAADPFA